MDERRDARRAKMVLAIERGRVLLDKQTVKTMLQHLYLSIGNLSHKRQDCHTCDAVEKYLEERDA